MEIKVKIEKGQELANLFRKYPQISLPNLRDAAMKSAFEIEGQAKDRAPVDTGRLRASIATSLGILNKGLSSVVSTNVSYAGYVHEGTKPHTPPYQAIKDWAKRKGIDKPYFVWKKIQKKGTKGTPFMRDGAEAAKNRIQRFYEVAIRNTMNTIARTA